MNNLIQYARFFSTQKGLYKIPFVFEPLKIESASHSSSSTSSFKKYFSNYHVYLRSRMKAPVYSLYKLNEPFREFFYRIKTQYAQLHYGDIDQEHFNYHYAQFHRQNFFHSNEFYVSDDVDIEYDNIFKSFAQNQALNTINEGELENKEEVSEDYIALYKDPVLESMAIIDPTQTKEPLSKMLQNLNNSYRNYYNQDESWLATQHVYYTDQNKIHTINYQGIIPPEYVFLTPYPAYRFYSQMIMRYDRYFFHPNFLYVPHMKKYIKRPIKIIGNMEIYEPEDLGD